MLTVEELATYLGTDVVVTDHPIIEAMEVAAVSLLGRIAHEWFGAPQSFVDVVDGLGGFSVWTDRTPRDGTIPVVEVRFLGGDWAAVSSSSLMCVGRRVLRSDGIAFPSSPLSVRLTYTAGVDEGDVFACGGKLTVEELKNAVRDIVRFLFREGREWTLKDLASPASAAVGGAAGVETIPSVQYIARLTYRPTV